MAKFNLRFSQVNSVGYTIEFDGTEDELRNKIISYDEKTWELIDDQKADVEQCSFDLEDVQRA